MSNTFEATLADILRNESTFESLDERAVEIGVLLPLLRQLGWNTDNVSEIYPQRGLSDGSKVDYDLQIDGDSRILIEVKRWGHILNDEDESQLAGYCRLAKPKLAVLTSGRSWRLYLPPNKGKATPLKRFGEIHITSTQPAKVASDFWQFLSRSGMVDFKPTLAAACELHRQSESYQKFKKTLINAWNQLASDTDMLAKFVMDFTENKGIPTSQENIVRFLESTDEPLVNEINTTASSHKKPASFTLPASPTGKNKRAFPMVGKPKGWNSLLLAICELMQKRHPDSFRQKILSMTDRFAESEHSKFSISVCDVGIYTKWGNSREIRSTCCDIVATFDYPKDSLEIKDSKGATL